MVTNPVRSLHSPGLTEAKARSSGDEASLLAELFAKKMKVGDPGRPVPVLPQETNRFVSFVSVMKGQVERLLSSLDVGKATGPDDISPWLLKNCVKELSGSLSVLFTSCMREEKWPSIWKAVRVV